MACDNAQCLEEVSSTLEVFWLRLSSYMMQGSSLAIHCCTMCASAPAGPIEGAFSDREFRAETRTDTHSSTRELTFFHRLRYLRELRFLSGNGDGRLVLHNF
ncbi:hypothetical protein BT96DRAFT_928929 [Gymnopus androsaceus JB14]|uniref:Uncharacterized protein n=1 Tax=Gymnopus androsaceus JB14 TaxID=1447944 RepID=A0A6A4GI43_9AGAR|nr:hypothetical protein BT96DRAFT_928929 [Gymnopus androsaceus JB14]